MERRAILIGAPTTTDFLPGVKEDIESLQEFLLSGRGGAWKSSEITILYDKTKSVIENAISRAKDAAYVLIVFTGHGYVKKDELGFNETFLILKDNVSISERSLNPRNHRCMIILDCCRHVENELIMDSQISKMTIAESADFEKLRVMYDDAVLRSEKGCIKVYAADLDQSASDEASFIRYLIAVLKKWAKNGRGVLCIDQAVDMTIEEMKKINPQQVPVYQGGRRLHHFPISVK